MLRFLLPLNINSVISASTCGSRIYCWRPVSSRMLHFLLPLNSSLQQNLLLLVNEQQDASLSSHNKLCIPELKCLQKNRHPTGFVVTLLMACHSGSYHFYREGSCVCLWLTVANFFGSPRCLRKKNSGPSHPLKEHRLMVPILGKNSAPLLRPTENFAPPLTQWKKLWLPFDYPKKFWSWQTDAPHLCPTTDIFPITTYIGRNRFRLRPSIVLDCNRSGSVSFL